VRSKDGSDLITGDRMKSCARHKINRLSDLVPTVQRAERGILRPYRVGKTRVEGVTHQPRHIVERRVKNCGLGSGQSFSLMSRRAGVKHSLRVRGRGGRRSDCCAELDRFCS
jgi:hypothetical protein